MFGFGNPKLHLLFATVTLVSSSRWTLGELTAASRKIGKCHCYSAWGRSKTYPIPPILRCFHQVRFENRLAFFLAESTLGPHRMVQKEFSGGYFCG